MQHECKITVIDKKCFTDYQEKYLADPKSGPCPFFNVGDEFILKRTPQQDDFYHLMNGKILRRGLGRRQPVCLHCPAGRLHYEGLDE